MERKLRCQLLIVALVAIACLVSCETPPTQSEEDHFGEVIGDDSPKTPAEARQIFNSLTAMTEGYYQAHISRGLKVKIANHELQNAIREWTDVSLDPLAQTSVRFRVSTAIYQMELLVGEYAPSDIDVAVYENPRVAADLTPDAAMEHHRFLKRQLNRIAGELLSRFTSIGNGRNKVRTSIAEWEYHAGSPEIAAFQRIETSQTIASLRTLLQAYRPAD